MDLVKRTVDGPGRANGEWTRFEPASRAIDTRHGVAEYWMFDPLGGALAVFVRDGDNFLVIADAAAGWTSPNTGVHVSVDDLELVVHGADGRRWLSPSDEARRADEMAARADEMAARADEMAARAEVADAENAELREELARLRGRSE